MIDQKIRDRQLEDSELTFRDIKIIKETPQSIYYTLLSHANGVRRIFIDVYLRDDTSFEGDEPINIKTYIAFKVSFLIYLIKLELGRESIDIKSSGGPFDRES